MELVLLFVVVVGLVWATVAVARIPLLWAALGYLVVASCFGHPFLQLDAAGMTLTLDRLMLLLVVAAAVVQGRLRGWLPQPLGAAEWCLLALLGWMAASFLWPQAPAAQGEEPPLHRYLQGYVIPAVLYFVGYHAPLSRRWLRHLAAFFLAFGGYLFWTAVAEHFGLFALVFPRYIANPNVGLHFGRARGPMVQSVSFGLYLGTCLLALVTLVPRWRSRLARRLAVLLAPAGLFATWATLTRSVWLGTAGGLGLVGLVRTPRRWRPWLLAAVGLGGLLVGTWYWDRLVAFQREGSATLTRESTSMRAAFAYVSWRMFLDYPLLGVGFGRFPEAKMPYLADRSLDLRLETIRNFAHHNTYLSILTETGLIGLLLYLALLALWVRSAFQVMRTRWVDPTVRDEQIPSSAFGLFVLAVLLLYAVQAMFHEVSYTPLDHALVFLLAGLLRQVHRRSGTPLRQVVQHGVQKPLKPKHDPVPVLAPGG